MSEDGDVDDLTFGEMMDFATDQIEDEIEDFEGDLPNHAFRLLVGRVADLGQQTSQFDMQRAHEDVDDPGDDEIQAHLSETMVDILLAVAAIEYEYGLDIEAQFEERMDFVETYKGAQDALMDAESEVERQEIIEEHFDTDEIEMGVEPGDNVDGEDYEHEESGRSFA